MREFDEMKLARAIAACGTVDGRVKLQKIVYILRAIGYALPFDDFWIRQHGPFSRAVACSLDILNSTGLVEETKTELSRNEFGEPVLQYSYQVSESVKPLLRKYFEIPTPAGRPPIDVLAVELCQKDRAVLEVAATKLYLRREDKLAGGPLDAELKRLKGHLSTQFAEADVLLGALREKGWLEQTDGPAEA